MCKDLGRSAVVLGLTVLLRASGAGAVDWIDCVRECWGMLDAGGPDCVVTAGLRKD